MFDGLSLAYPTADPKDGTTHWAWSPDGTEWTSIVALPRHTTRLVTDGTPTGAFAFTESYPEDDAAVGQLWRTTDGSTWRLAADISSWGAPVSYAVSNGHFVVVSNGNIHLPPETVRVYVSDDGWTWDRAYVPEMAARGYVRIDGTDAGFIAQWWSGPVFSTWEEADAYAGDDPYLYSTSDDGRTWSPAVLYPVGASIVYRVPGGFVAYEFSDWSDALAFEPDGALIAAWTSSNGFDWTKRDVVGLPPTRGDPDMNGGRLYQVPGGFLFDQYQRSRLSYSPDGLRWSAVNAPDEYFIDPGSPDTIRFGTLVSLDLAAPTRLWFSPTPTP